MTTHTATTDKATFLRCGSRIRAGEAMITAMDGACVITAHADAACGMPSLRVTDATISALAPGTRVRFRSQRTRMRRVPSRTRPATT